MNSFAIGLVSSAAIFSGALLGMRLQRLLPGHHLNKEMQDLVKVSAGTIATLTALVLGLLVSSAKSSFDTVNSGIVQASAKSILLDRALARYGPDAKAAREQLKRAVATSIQLAWPKEKTGVPAVTALEGATGSELLQDKLGELAPQNDRQRQVLAQALQLANDVGQTRWLLIEQAQSQLPLPLLVILIFWLVLLFVSFGLYAPRNATAVTVLLIGACAISASIFLVLELNRPLDGLIKVSNAPLLNALGHLGE
jgi:lipopolysaccharide export LptBFGC system permease protein LptF